MQIPKNAKGMQIAVILVQMLAPNWNNKQIASLYRLSTRRVQQIKREIQVL